MSRLGGVLFQVANCHVSSVSSHWQKLGRGREFKVSFLGTLLSFVMVLLSGPCCLLRLSLWAVAFYHLNFGGHVQYMILFEGLAQSHLRMLRVNTLTADSKCCMENWWKIVKNDTKWFRTFFKYFVRFRQWSQTEEVCFRRWQQWNLTLDRLW